MAEMTHDLLLLFFFGWLVCPVVGTMFSLVKLQGWRHPFQQPEAGCPSARVPSGFFIHHWVWWCWLRGKKENSTDSPGMSTSFPGLPAAETERTGQLPLSTGWGPRFAGAGRPLCSGVWGVLMWQPVFPKVSSGSHSQNSRTICTIFFSSLNLNQDKWDSKMLTLKKKL